MRRMANGDANATLPEPFAISSSPTVPYVSRMFKNSGTGLPWWCSGEESACQCRGHGLETWSEKIPHATEQVSLCATTTEPAL